MKQDPHLQELADIKLALAVLAEQLDALDARQNSSFVTADPPDTTDKSFAQRAVLAMRHIPAENESLSKSSEASQELAGTTSTAFAAWPLMATT